MYPEHFHVCVSCVCKCCDFVPATCPRYTSLLRVASLCTTQGFAAATCRWDMSLQHDPSCLPTFKVAGERIRHHYAFMQRVRTKYHN